LIRYSSTQGLPLEDGVARCSTVRRPASFAMPDVSHLPRCPVTAKVAFPTKAKARAMYRPRPGDRRRFGAFRCAWCDAYHIGHR